jgi:hypothetical protein
MIQDSVPGGILARTLRNAQDWPLAVKIGVVAIPLLLATVGASTYAIMFPNLLTPIKPILAIVLPFLGMYEWTSLMKEIIDQCGYSFDHRVRQ